MVAYRMVLLAGAVAALPLNINLGAYSPALVVGDGEISFGGNSDVSALMSVLQGAAQSAANGAAANTGGAQGEAAGAKAAPAAAAAAAGTGNAAAAQQQSGQAQPSAVPATASTSTTASVDPTLQEQANQIAALQGMGKSVAPRAEPAGEETSNVSKRDMAGFDRALQFAEAALVKGPKVQMGTGEGGSGVGILVDNNVQAASRIGTGAAKRVVQATSRIGTGAAKREVAPRVKVTTMYVRSGIPSSLQNGNSLSARDILESANVEARYETIQIAPSKRDGSSAAGGAIDAVNLNVSGGEGVTMTFVETLEDGEDA